MGKGRGRRNRRPGPVIGGALLWMLVAEAVVAALIVAARLWMEFGR